MKLLDTDLDIDPNAVFRPKMAAPILGYKLSQLYEKIASGEIEPPFPLSEHGRAVGWTGAMLILHHRKRLALRKRRHGERPRIADEAPR
jgi:hypothetical protein